MTQNDLFEAAINMTLISQNNSVVELTTGDVVRIDHTNDTNIYFEYNSELFRLDTYSFSQSFNKRKLTEVKKTGTQSKISEILDSMKSLLLYKNTKYGDSALTPKNIFYKGDSTNSILIRLDDKLGRIMNNQDEIRVNDVCDLIGYLTLLLVSMGVNKSDIEKLKD